MEILSSFKTPIRFYKYPISHDIPRHENLKFRFINTVFWNVTPCNLVEGYPEDGISRFLINVGIFPPDYTSLHPRKQ